MEKPWALMRRPGLCCGWRRLRVLLDGGADHGFDILHGGMIALIGVEGIVQQEFGGFEFCLCNDLDGAAKGDAFIGSGLGRMAG